MTVHDIARPTVLLTGPTSGIGAATLRQLISHPARPDLVLLGRNVAALEAAADEARSHRLTARAVRLDLAGLDSVRAAVREVGDLIDAGLVRPLDAVILNAGAQFKTRRSASAQGYEQTFAVNVIAQHALLRGLQSRLADRGHVILLGSSTHRGKRQSFNLIPDPKWQAPADLARPMPAATGTESATAEWEHSGVAYASSKLALVTLAHEWADELEKSGHRLNTYDPGLVVGTGLVREMSAFRYWVWKYVMPVMALHPKATLPRITGRHLTELALGDAHPRLHDGYVEIGRLTKAEAVTFDADRRWMLWSWLEDAIAAESSSERDAASTAEA